MSENNKQNLSNPKDKYDHSAIRVLKGLEGIRIRPGMYIGDTGENGLHHLIWEAIDNAVDEASHGYGKEIVVRLKANKVVSVTDYGRGIPVDIHPDTNISTLETVLTTVHSGGKFNNNTYTHSGGTNGVGITCVNALSEWLEVNVYRDGKKYQAIFTDGGKIKQATKVISEDIGSRTGTEISWKIDDTIFDPETKYNSDDISNRLKDLAYLNPGIKFVLIQEEINKENAWESENGIVDWIKEINSTTDRQGLNGVPIISGSSTSAINNLKVNFAFQYVKNLDPKIDDFSNNIAFSNNIHNKNGGAHIKGFKNGLSKVVKKWMLDDKLIKNSNEIKQEDVTSPLIAIISVYSSDRNYKNQTKDEWPSPKSIKPIEYIVAEQFERYLLENPQQRKLIFERIIEQRNWRLKLDRDKETQRKTLLDSFSSLPGKLADCSTKDPSISELYIVEGDSAGGSAKSGREREFQAILPLKGKILNTEKKSDTSSFSNNEEIKSLINAIGCQYSDSFNLKKLRYNKIIIMTDADVDGLHIRILLLTFFYRNMRQLIDAGHVYIAQPPLFRISYTKKNLYLATEELLEEYKNKHQNERYEVSRFKGLGEMSPEQLWETTMDPKNRTLLKVNIADAINADQMFSALMGTDTKPRKEFILKNDKEIKDLDI
ncbi:DNA gyrase subunit B [[Mycoplasma] cavipharyngis]|uniref:DNA gyrase/topoisomerase IV subunit B n=1 Tax=[Mycoplasma] cavipharyngis TaxID=92757 RepID=UPI003704AAEF